MSPSKGDESVPEGKRYTFQGSKGFARFDAYGHRSTHLLATACLFTHETKRVHGFFPRFSRRIRISLCLSSYALYQFAFNLYVIGSVWLRSCCACTLYNSFFLLSFYPLVDSRLV